MRQVSSKILKYLILFFLLIIPFINLTFSYYSVGKEITKPLDLNTSANEFSEVDLSFIPDIDYTTLNDQWYNPKIEMLIITPNNSEFINKTDSLVNLAKWKNKKGVKTVILSNFSLYDGRDDAERIRNMIKSYYAKENIQWVLLVGDTDILPVRMVYNPDVFRWGEGRTETISGEYYKPTDFYYADLSGTWDSDEDGDWGESPEDNEYGLDEIDWTPDVYVGRFPASSVEELEIMANKTLKYETDPETGDWMNRMLLAGGVSDYSISGLPDSGEYESTLTNYIIKNYAKSVVNYTHLVKEEGNLSRSSLNSSFNDGYSTVIMAGHGSPTTYYIDVSTTGYKSEDAEASSNDHMPSLVYLDACSTSSYDNDISLGEKLINNTIGGAIGVVGGLRVNWYFVDDYYLAALNRGNAKLFWKEFFENKKFQQGRALYDSKVAYMNSDYYKIGSQIGERIVQGSTDLDYERKNLLTYNLLGDPEVDIYTNIPKSAQNPFTGDIYEGQLITAIIKDVDGKVIPRARVHLESLDGKYFTEYADENGLVNIQMLAQKNEFYNVTITGHNVVRSTYNFTTLPDNEKPELQRIQITPKKPSTSDKITLEIDFMENGSGIESVYVILSKNGFQDFSYYSQSSVLIEEGNDIKVTIDQLLPDDYSFFIFARDYANNTNVFYDDSFKFSIPKPIIDYILPISIVVIIGIVGYSSYAVFRSIGKHSREIHNIK
ncbi:hypothetical protein LCGC14_0969120 [marine sediment metagenome]|uniref:Gingipain domain-containing protein n=1 Tax=marine sediment metagenome TaxID=412755 RepID=A0A0F9QVC8_9ZZZZ